MLRELELRRPLIVVALALLSTTVTLSLGSVAMGLPIGHGPQANSIHRA